ncbi:MAG TPA: SH3 domain-containing protein [Pseudonocardia sp.]
MAKRRYLFFVEGEGGKRRFNFRGWPFVILIGLLLTFLSLIDRGGLSAVRSSATGASCTFTVDGDGVNVRNQATATSAQVQQLTKGTTVTATPTVSNGFRQLADGDWVLDNYLTPVSGTTCG